MILGDFNINILPRPPPPSPSTSALLDWIDNQDLCLLNMSSPTRFNYTGSASLIDLSIISPALYNSIHFYVHPDSFDFDHHPIIFLTSLPSSHSAPPRRIPCWSKASALLNSMPSLPDT